MYHSFNNSRGKRIVLAFQEKNCAEKISVLAEKHMRRISSVTFIYMFVCAALCGAAIRVFRADIGFPLLFDGAFYDQ